ncbi:hypothetical protein NE865_07546 [Phthorimaea operculella]|nr:hypothetical protein NE865_07546 [Phthorimaea operculella]
MGGDSKLAPDLQNTISRLRNDLNERDQAVLLNDIEISGIPEFKGESPVHLAISVAAKLGLNIAENEIVSAGRVGLKPKDNQDLDDSQVNKDNTGGEDNKIVRARPIVVRLTRYALRCKFLQEARIRRNATTVDLGLPPHTPQKFYVNERLTKENRLLFRNTRAAAANAKPQKWKHVWTKDGKIMTRCTDTSKVMRIRTQEDIDRIFQETTTVVHSEQKQSL